VIDSVCVPRSAGRLVAASATGKGPTQPILYRVLGVSRRRGALSVDREVDVSEDKGAVVIVSQAEQGQRPVPQALFGPSGPARRAPLVLPSENIGLGCHSSRTQAAATRPRPEQAHSYLVPTVGGNMSSGLGGGKLHVELLLPCRRDRRGPRRQADPFQVSTDGAGVVK